MSHIYGDAVVLVQKSRDGSVRRVNAIVLGSRDRSPTAADGKVLEADGAALPEEEHLDLAYPELGLVVEGQMLTTRDIDSIFRKTSETRAWAEGAWIGFEEGVEAQLAQATKALSDITIRLADAYTEIDRLTAITNQKPVDPPVDSGLPSAADLDADAAEKQAATDTSTEAST